MTTAQTILITCHEKGRDDSFDADVAADCTVAEILAGLVETGYLSGPTGTDTYTLINGRTGVELPKDGTLESSDVRSGDVITVAKTHNGA